jgi:hypothetical protein
MGAEVERRLRDEIEYVGLRAHATAVGLIQLTIELLNAGALHEAAVGRIKDVIVKDLSLSRPRTVPKAQFERETRARLDRIFAGEQTLD